ncbi:28 kDa heat- and acid-stable phosphoprotein-like isoform X4 [Phoenix dactylifera]|uniref:28 kDa heat- and acid-stable phosphoprotein-like isoform X4 n=1 Tax=Phoenix dactylifera TaxID=42345 RepID=A0A8B9A4C0_PHODC|nr:28 kDa heat- and acid-stable phosphoprotein-like isoform X4 [Phoenix dactylifera]
MGKGKFKGKPTGRRNFSTLEEMIAGTSSRPRRFKQVEVEHKEGEEIEEESEEDSEEETERRKGIQGIIQIENPNLVKPKTMKAGQADLERTTELSRRERASGLSTKTKSRSCKEARRGKSWFDNLDAWLDNG